MLVNGKRRHLSASLYADSDPAQGSNAVDLDMTPLAAIDHIEIFQDGAAAQFGSDAIAGVINVILKKADKGFQMSALGGGYADGGGVTGQLDGGAQPAQVQGDPRSDLETFGFNLDKPLTADVLLNRVMLQVRITI